MSKARDLANAGTALGAVTATELGYVDGVTSAIQTQIDTKAPSSTAVTLTDTQTLTNKTLTNPVIASVINNSLVDAKGDVLTATADNTPARLAVGANDTVLTADSSAATGLKWATPVSGSMTSLATGTLASTGNTTISSFSTSYKDLILEVYNYINTSDDLGMRFNSDSGASQYGFTSFGNSTSVANSDNQTYINAVGYGDTGSNGTARIWLHNYNDSSRMKPVAFEQTTSSPVRRKFGTGSWKGTSAITTITMFPISGTITSGTYTLWGVN